ncbi:hypothetical protein N7454_001005 [Penicillium verhagenii]|nr:hypothetical protein N7454_001005 [Penicillium verhagenii]
MDREHELLSTDSFGVWYGNELLDGSLSTIDRANATYHEPLPKDASLPTRSIALTGTLSLHDYRKHLALAAQCTDDPVDRSEKTLRRKTATSNLNRPSEIVPVPYAASTTSSVASTPPPLSPSCSHSILSLRSDQDEVSESGQLQSGGHPTQGPRVGLVSEHLTRPRPNRKRLNTFREKLEARGQAQHSPLSRPQKSESDPMLATTHATISHGGASFEILNPRKSLDFARIVSFIEDVDSCSIFSDQIRDSTLSSFSIDQGLDRSSLSQFTDASLPSHYSSQSLYTSLSSPYSTPKRQTADIPSSSPGVHDKIHSFSEYSTNEYDSWSFDRYEPKQLHNDTVGEEYSPRPRMTSISERIEEREEELASYPSDSTKRPSTSSSSSSSPPTYYSESEIGEPGSPVYANGEWSQVDGRDRGIFLELPPSPSSPSPYDIETENEAENENDPPSPYDTYLANTMSPAYSNHYDHDPYDPIYFDPHVQSVLAAANAETMGLRGHPARALDDLQRRFQSSVSLAEGGRKGDNSQRKRLRKFFSWRSGN